MDLNFTTSFYCEKYYDEKKDCKYQIVVHEGTGKEAKQCAVCLTIDAYQIEDTYVLICQACGEEKEIEEDIEFSHSITCEKCGLIGNIGLEELNQNEQFLLEKKDIKATCKVCRSRTFVDEKKEKLKCPECRRELKRKMSSMWEEGQS